MGLRRVGIMGLGRMGGIRRVVLGRVGRGVLGMGRGRVIWGVGLGVRRGGGILLRRVVILLRGILGVRLGIVVLVGVSWLASGGGGG